MTGNNGKKNDQKMKPFLVYEYLMRNSDASHTVSANEIVGYLQKCGISAERRSIYTDIRRCLTVASFNDIMGKTTHQNDVFKDWKATMLPYLL